MLCRPVLQLFPQAANVNVHRTDVAPVFISPDGVQQRLPGIDPVYLPQRLWSELTKWVLWFCAIRRIA